MKKFLKELAAITFASLFFVAQSYAFTDLLPIGANSDTIPVSNGSGWTLQQIPDSLAVFHAAYGGNGYTTTGGRAFAAGIPFNMYASTGAININGTVVPSTFTAYTGIGNGNLPYAWYSYPGKTIEVTGRGLYSTTAVATNWVWGISIGTYPICSITQTAPASITNASWNESALITLQSTGTLNTAPFLYSLSVTYSTSAYGTPITLSTGSVAAISGIPWGGAFNPTFTWSVNSGSITANTYIVTAKN